ncbi:hypothetical protein A343_2062 [Porphyromonas gingivalis JCVI SC001]|nr:hypothetical protein A343_2062 [Porphyromonas gingivalis JCVI SC001]
MGRAGAMLSYVTTGIGTKQSRMFAVATGKWIRCSFLYLNSLL